MTDSECVFAAWSAIGEQKVKASEAFDVIKSTLGSSKL